MVNDTLETLTFHILTWKGTDHTASEENQNQRFCYLFLFSLKWPIQDVGLKCTNMNDVFTNVGTPRYNCFFWTFWSDSSLSLCFASRWRKSTGLWTTEADSFISAEAATFISEKSKKKTMHSRISYGDQLWSILGLCVCVCVCVAVVLATYRVPKSTFYQQN